MINTRCPSADRVKSIKNAAQVNISATDQLIQELLAEKQALLGKLKTRTGTSMGYTDRGTNTGTRPGADS